MRSSVTHKDYTTIDPATMADDPAATAVSEGLVGVHTPESMARIGAWRWQLVSHCATTIVKALQGRYAIDFGGAAAPIGYGAIVVDRLTEHRTLDDVPADVAVIFTSHTLEHVVDLEFCLDGMYRKLAPGGLLIAHVPGCDSENLRAENFPHHAQTFCLAGSEEPRLPGWVALDEAMAAAGFTLQYVSEGWGCLMVIGWKENNGSV